MAYQPGQQQPYYPTYSQPPQQQQQAKSSSSNSDESKYTNAQFMLWGFCCLIILLFVVMFIVSIVYWHRGDHFRGHMNRVVSDLIEQNSAQADTRNMVSFSALQASAAERAQHAVLKNNRYAFCYTDLLWTETDEQGAVLQSVPDQLQVRERAYYYALDLKLSVEFDTDTSSYVLNAQRLDSSQRYMTLSYLITSTYTRFSTIKLVESGLDARTRMLVRTRDIVLCSNNPLLNSRPCSSSALLDDSLTAERAITSIFVKNTKLIVMSKLPPQQTTTGGGNSKARNSSDQRKKQPPPDAEAGDTADRTNTAASAEQYDIVRSDSSMSRYRLDEDFTRDIRVYNIEFYRAVPTGADTSGEREREPVFKESMVFHVRPNKCK
jgi:hypothetical protein